MTNEEMIKKMSEEITFLLESGEELENHSNKNNVKIIALINLLIKEGVITKEKLDKEIEIQSRQ
ncbi:hypothetical protein J22TS1_43890 [Siminovitchia terrae]|uniref:hypothetical protein n=1 Tax=Siminovitchia terrae TaxID=1914933 RepID=UPI001B28C370|nr:hypothetical protein [Siminovitchia terrae]GIN93338.1 hypothetical protein J22TS1_43890 [Siminovitchia terrae]